METCPDMHFGNATTGQCELRKYTCYVRLAPREKRVKGGSKGEWVLPIHAFPKMLGGN